MKNTWITSPVNSYLLSYPRSGNTWLRYCIEALTHYPTNGVGEGRSPEVIQTMVDAGDGEVAHYLMGPLSTLVPAGADLDLPAIAHKRHRMDPGSYDPEAKLIVIVRNYKEAILRNRCYHPGWKLRGDWRDRFYDSVPAYLQPFNVYQGWRGPRMLLYYEDLMESDASVFIRLLEFLDRGGAARIPDFLDDLNEHRAESVELYNEYVKGSASRGTDNHFHSKHLADEDRQWMDRILLSQIPTDRCCFSRYVEEQTLADRPDLGGV